MRLVSEKSETIDRIADLCRHLEQADLDRIVTGREVRLLASRTVLDFGELRRSSRHGCGYERVVAIGAMASKVVGDVKSPCGALRASVNLNWQACDSRNTASVAEHFRSGDKMNDDYGAVSRQYHRNE